MASVRVFFHNHCFDGTASAAMFTAFFRTRRPDASFQYLGLAHTANSLFDPGQFTADENVIVDFKYCPDPRVTWWFDHHQSAFLTPADAEHFRQDTSGQKFYDPSMGSCTRFLAEVTQQRFGFDPAPWAELVGWADIVDQARFPSAQAAVELGQPALKLTLAIEGSTREDFLPRLIPDLLRHPLAAILELDYVRRELDPLLARHQRSIAQLRDRIELRQGVVFFDVSDLDLEGYNKFIPYFLCPEAVYSIGISRSAYRMKVSVGTNPWTRESRLANLADICERYGGGGHPRVGAISFPPGEIEPARRAAAEIVGELRASLSAG